MHVSSPAVFKDAFILFLSPFPPGGPGDGPDCQLTHEINGFGPIPWKSTYSGPDPWEMSARFFGPYSTGIRQHDPCNVNKSRGRGWVTAISSLQNS